MHDPFVLNSGTIQLMIYLPVIWINKMDMFGIKGERLALILRGVFGFFAGVLYYFAYRLIPLADATTIVFSAPVFVFVFACFLLKEECGLFQVLILMMTLIGVAFVSRPSFIFGDIIEESLPFRLEGTMFAIVSCLVTALCFIVLRMLPKKDTAVIINMFSLITIVLGIACLVVIKTCFPEEAVLMADKIRIPYTRHDIIYLNVNGLCFVSAQFCFTLALKVEEAGLVSISRTMDIVLAFLFQVIWLPNEIVNWTSILGAVIVSAAVTLSALKKYLSQYPGKHERLYSIVNCGSSSR